MPVEFMDRGVGDLSPTPLRAVTGSPDIEDQNWL
jgi:hypothetical protein